ncbi:MAG: hypothetical protein JNM81_13180 [Rhodospirillaceae bacterium]|nr:hypothetical protein [Rhodospirillaceae bacterium]
MITKLSLITLVAATALATTAWAQPKSHDSSGMRDACAADIATHCAGVAQGQPTMQCVMKNRDKMSDGCKAAMATMRQGGGQGGGMGGGMGGGAPAAKPEEKKPM